MTKLKYSDERYDETALDRLERKTDRTSSDCWLWLGGCFKSGYGRISYRGQPAYAHRISYLLHRGQIPEGLELDHLCRIRHCCNPDHLEPVTHRENLMRSPIHPFFRAARGETR